MSVITQTRQYEVLELGNGLKVVCWQREGMVSYIGVAVGSGSRDEPESCQGLAHFVEHTIFKGTETRKGWQISNHMEKVGGEINAYTSKEETMIYTSAPAGFENRSMELLSDMIKRCSFPKEEIEKEKDVVIEEICSYLDSPSELVYDDFEELAYKGSDLAHNILGTEESVRHLTGKDCKQFVESNYTPGNMVVYCCSSMPASRVQRLVERYFGDMNFIDNPRKRIAPPQMESFDIVRKMDNHQANTIVGARTFGRRDNRRFALFLLNNYLAGPAMNSVLSRELREKRGYVYTVDSNVSLMSDTGLFAIYFACHERDISRCRRIIYSQIDRLCQSRLPERSFESIKRQYCGQLLVNSDHIESRAMGLAKSMLYFGCVNDISVTKERIMEVTAQEFMETARVIAPSNCSTLSIT